MTGGVLGNGTRVAYSSTSPVSWVKLPQLADIDGIELSSADVDVTVHSGGKFKRKMPGLIESKDVTLTLVADLDETITATHMALEALVLAQTTIYWRVEVPTTRAQAKWKPFEWMGYVKSWSVTTTKENRQEIKCMIAFDDTTLGVYAATASSAIG